MPGTQINAKLHFIEVFEMSEKELPKESFIEKSEIEERVASYFETIQNIHLEVASFKETMSDVTIKQYIHFDNNGLVVGIDIPDGYYLDVYGDYTTHVDSHVMFGDWWGEVHHSQENPFKVNRLVAIINERSTEVHFAQKDDNGQPNKMATVNFEDIKDITIDICEDIKTTTNQLSEIFGFSKVESQKLFRGDEEYSPIISRALSVLAKHIKRGECFGVIRQSCQALGGKSILEGLYEDPVEVLRLVEDSFDFST